MFSDFRKLLGESMSNNNWTNPYKTLKINHKCIAEFVHEDIKVFNIKIDLKNMSNKTLNSLKLKIFNPDDSLKIIHYFNIEYDDIHKFWILPEWKTICGGLSTNETFTFNITVNDDKNIIITDN